MGARAVLTVAACLASAAALGGCSLDSDDGGAALPESALPQIVLQLDDLPNAFSTFDEGPIAIADAPQGPRGDPERFGRAGGWKARYRRPGDATTEGPLVVESRVDLFDGSGGAREEHELQREELTLQAGGPAEVVEIEDLGDEAVALTAGADVPPGTLATFTVAWRHGNATASVTANGLGRRLGLRDVVALARAQARRIEAAAAGTN